MRQTAASVRAVVFSCLALSFPAWTAAGADDIAELKRAIEALQAESRELTRRLATLEAEVSRREQALEHERTQQQTEGAETQPTKAESTEREELERRLKELEIAKPAQEDAVRSIIRSAVSTLGSKINEFVTLGGALEVAAARSKDFSGPFQSTIGLSTAEFDFEIQANDWTLGSIVIEYVDGTNFLFPTTQGFSAGVDRFNLDTAVVTVGDPQKFPPFARVGRMILPFGISTGVHRADVLSIDSPMTIEAFEMRKTGIGFGLGFPTPALTPPTPPVVVPPVRPQVFNPLIRSLSRGLGYHPPPTRPTPPAPFTPTPVEPLFNAGIYFYDGNTLKARDGRSRPFKHVAATMGFHARGHCGRPYHELRWSDSCPWSLDVDVDYNSSLFDSRFLEEEYRGFLGRIGFVRGMAAHVKSTSGPISLVGEWNGAIKRATFLDDVGKRVSIRPAAWQVTLGYQFDWNPWVETIGAQGTFLSIGYSQSRDLAGVTQLINDRPSRVGSLPKKRVLLTAGEHVLDGVKLTIEYSYNWDYSKLESGTGRSAKAILTSLTYAW
jgi:hypothetical protein